MNAQFAIVLLVSLLAHCSGKPHILRKRGATGVRNILQRVTGELAEDTKHLTGVTPLLHSIVNKFSALDEKIEYTVFGILSSLLASVDPEAGELLMKVWVKFDHFMQSNGNEIGDAIAAIIRSIARSDIGEDLPADPCLAPGDENDVSLGDFTNIGGEDNRNGDPSGTGSLGNLGSLLGGLVGTVGLGGKGWSDAGGGSTEPTGNEGKGEYNGSGDLSGTGSLGNLGSLLGGLVGTVGLGGKGRSDAGGGFTAPTGNEGKGKVIPDIGGTGGLLGGLLN